MPSTPLSFSRLLGAVAASVVMVGMLGAAQTPDDLAWQRFLGWLKVAPPANGPLEILQGYQGTLTQQGIAAADAGREMGTVMRLMRERDDAWPLMFDRIYKSATPNFDTRPNALLMAAVEGRTPAGRSTSAWARAATPSGWPSKAGR